MEFKVYRCNHCGNMVAYIREAGVPIICCGEPMQQLIPGTTDAAVEKHLPVITQTGNIVTVNVGEVDHPMTEDHYIEWILLQTKQGKQRKELEPNSAPNTEFALTDGDEVIAAYAYCNLHGLWKK